MLLRIILIVLLLSCQPARADGTWLEFTAGSSTPATVWTGQNAPVPGVNIDTNATVLPWTPQNNDNNPQDYQLKNGAVVYAPPVPPTPPTPHPGANPQLFIDSCVSDSQVQSIFYLLAPYQYAITQYGIDPQAVQLLWNQLCIQYGGQQGPLTSQIQQVIEKYASQAGMPLVAQ